MVAPKRFQHPDDQSAEDGMWYDATPTSLLATEPVLKTVLFVDWVSLWGPDPVQVSE